MESPTANSQSCSVYENGNHSTFHEDDECDSSAHPTKVALDEDLLPTATVPADEEDDEPGRNEKKIRTTIRCIMSTR